MKGEQQRLKEKEQRLKEEEKRLKGEQQKLKEKEIISLKGAKRSDDKQKNQKIKWYCKMV